MPDNPLLLVAMMVYVTAGFAVMVKIMRPAFDVLDASRNKEYGPCTIHDMIRAVRYYRRTQAMILVYGLISFAFWPLLPVIARFIPHQPTTETK